MLETIHEFKTLRLEREDDIVQITLNRPDRLNAIDDVMFEDVPRAVRMIADDETVRAVIYTGAGRAFCAGREMAALVDRAKAPEKFGVPKPAGREMEFVEGLQVPVIAAVNGAAAGAGMGVALLADFRIASDAAVFAEAHVQRGLAPSVAAWYLPRLMGVAKAMEVLLLEKRINAQDALRYGIVNSVVSAERLLPEAWALARRLAELPPLTVRFTKYCVQQGLSSSLDEVRASAGWAQVLTRLRTDEQISTSTKR
ncbi:MAG: enoyl-CoA hydratase/isomerase family protein [Burkholderiaceae bacterium]|nr:enoyl-CoA hydratase/isomerase family protein [Burkholderiaceae bacterium]